MRKQGKRVGKIVLVLLGSAALSTGCSHDDGWVAQDSSGSLDIRQDVYASKDECVSDWGGKQENCVAQSATGRWVGPHYQYNFASGQVSRVPVLGFSDSGPTKLGSPVGGVSKFGQTSTVHRVSPAGGGKTVARGGFGSTGRGFFSGGG